MTVRRLCSFALLAIACGGGDARPQGIGLTDTAGQGSLPPPESNLGGAGAAEGGAAGAAGADIAGDTGISYEPGETPPEIPGLCPPDLTLGADQSVALEPSESALVAMTADELSVAFTTEDAAVTLLHVADRASTSEAFAPLVVELPAGYSAAHGVSLTSDGLTLVIVREDQDGFAELSRQTRGERFGSEADEARFVAINGQKLTSGRTVGFPVISVDGRALYFVRFFAGTLVVQSSLGDDGRFDQGSEIDEFTLGGPPGEHKLIHGLSADQRAIFFDDQASGHAMALFRSREGGPFYYPLDLGERQGAVPNRDCSRVYSTLDGKLVEQRVN